MQILLIKRCFLVGVLSITLAACKANKPEPMADYQQFCAGCHGTDLSGGLGTSLASGEWHQDTGQDLAQVIRDGIPGTGMPGFGGGLSEVRIAALADLIRASNSERPSNNSHDRLGSNIEAEHFISERSMGIEITTSTSDPSLTYVAYFDAGKSMCYDQVDLTGARSLDLVYAKNGNPGRFAILAYKTDNETPINLGEYSPGETGGWESFQSLRVGLSTQLEGAHWLCFMGVQGGGILNMDHFSLSAEPGENQGNERAFRLNDGILSLFKATDVISAGGYHFRLEKVGDAPGILWAMDFLPDATLVASQRDGNLWLFRHGERLGPVLGTPPVFHRGQGGLLDVSVHPDYNKNGWIYLTFADTADDGETTATRVVRGKLDGLRWVNQEDIYTAAADFYIDTSHHFGSRLIFKDGYIYFSIGDRGQPTQAQELTFPNGKIHRLHDDGRIPQDNPFVNHPQALASLWTYGHRNPQGLALHPRTGALWSAEHGPRGGDELNLLHTGGNYGWPLVTHGINYNGTPITELTQKEGMESPRHHWTPSIAVSGIRVYEGDKFPRWQGHLLAASLAAQQLRLVRLDGDTVVADELLLENLGRIRDVAMGPDGYPYLVFNDPDGTLYRLVPTAMAALEEPLWETAGLRRPESVRVHQLDGKTVLLVSEIEGEGDGFDGAGGIALLDTDGRIIDQDFIRGLNAPKGMAIYENRLFVADIDALVEIDLTTRKQIARHPAPDAKFLNDVVVDKQGRVYVSDSHRARVYRLAEGQVDIYLENLTGANGLYISGDDLLIGADTVLWRARNDEVTEMANGFEAAIDGIEPVTAGGYIVTCWQGLVYHLDEKSGLTKLLDSRPTRAGDPGYDPQTNTLYIPTLSNNSVKAYRL